MTGSRGLSQEEAGRRLAERGPVEPAASSRSYRSIVRANTLTVFNAILVAFGVLTLAFADWRDALFLFILVANSGIGIAQEVRAKRSLDRLAALIAPRATVVRDGSARELRVEDVVPDDLVELRPGNQVVADGQLEEASGLLLDESILTGESRPVARGVGFENSVIRSDGLHAAALYSLMRPPSSACLWMCRIGAPPGTEVGSSGG